MGRPRNEVAAVAVALIVVSAASLLIAVSLPVRATSVPLTGKYIMAFLACNTSTSTCSNPQNHVTYLAESNDSITWGPVPGFTPYAGSVPDVIRRGNTVYIYNPGMLVRFHIDTGVQSPPIAASLKFANGSSTIFVDPSVFLDSSGTLHLFYLPGIVGQDPASCPTGQSTCTKTIMSATEVAGSDGGSFVVDSGTRASYTISQCCFSDPAVFQGPDGYYLYVSEGQAVIAFDSSSLTGSYSTVQGLSGGVLVPQGTGGVPAGYYDNSTRMFWTFITQGSSVQVIAKASTSSINSQIGSSAFSTNISGCNLAGLGCSYTVESPGFHLNTAGTTTASTSSSSTTTSSTSTTVTSSTTSASSTSSTFTSSSTTSASSTPTLSSTTTATSPTSTSTSTATFLTSLSSSTTSTFTTTFTSVPTHPTVSSASTTTTTTTTTASGGIPEFPYQTVAVSTVTAIVVVLYLIVRSCSES